LDITKEIVFFFFFKFLHEDKKISFVHLLYYFYFI
jgi:hypothetical protein